MNFVLLKGLFDRMNIFTAKTQRAQRKKINRYAIFFGSKCPQGLFLIVFRRPCPAKSGVNGKQ